MLRPKNCKKCGGRMKQAGGIQTYTQTNTPKGAITPTGQSNLATLTPEQIRAMASQYGFRTDNNANLQQDLFKYAQQNQPQAYQQMIDKYGQTASGTFVDNMLGARTADLLQSLNPPQQQTPQPYRATSTLSEHMFGPGQRALGAASQRYRDSYEITEAGMRDTGSPQEYIDFQFYKPNSTEFDSSRGRYRIPNDIFQNQISRGTTTIQDPSLLDQYRIPDNPSNTVMKMKGGKFRMQSAGTIPQQQDYPDYESWQAAMDQFLSGQQETVIPSSSSFRPNSTPSGSPNNPYQNLQNIGIGMRAVRTGLGEIAGRMERGRQNQYDYQQQTALGQMNPMPYEDFQPNPYNLYMQMGGNLKTIAKQYQQFSNDANFDFGSGDDDRGMMTPEGYHIMPDGTLMRNSEMDNSYMKKGGYEIDRMMIVRKLLPELLKLGRLGSGKYRNYKKGGVNKWN